MPEFGTYAEWFTFAPDRYDQSSELPADYNAGNRFYGRDAGIKLHRGAPEGESLSNVDPTAS